MIKRLFCLVLFVIAAASVRAGDKIKVYFNHPVDASVSSGVPAAYLNNCTADTFVAYINRAKYTIDVAQYDYQQNGYANIATAINNAYDRGVKIRWIYDGSSTNSGLAYLNSAIYTLGSPTSSGYGIMHNKFVIIDAYSSDPADAIVWTGSYDWSNEQFNSDYNNAIVIQDSALAHAYTDEFNMMWGDTGIAPNATAAKFGPHKTDLGRHSFTIDGDHVELYFSPSDGTNSHIQSTIATANTDMYFGIYTFTDNTDATDIVNRYTAGVYVSGICDYFSHSYTSSSTLSSGLGSHYKIYDGSGIYHSKYLIVDPSDQCSDPLVLTGSHNWSYSADTKNDENTLIIHNDTIANQYYQSFHADFTSMGGSLSTVTGCPTSVQAVGANEDDVIIYPNPSTETFAIKYTTVVPSKVTLRVTDALGKMVETNTADVSGAGEQQLTFAPRQAGVYFVNITIGNKFYSRKLVKL